MMDILKHINWIDILGAIIIFRMTYVAFREGLAHQIFPLFGTISVMVLSLHYYAGFGSLISRQLFNSPLNLCNFMSFSIIAVLSTFIFKLLNVLLDKTVKMQWNPIIEKFGGLVFGGLRAIVAASLTLIIIALIPVPYFQRSIRDKSLTGMYVIGVGPSIYGRIAPFLPIIKIGGDRGGRDEIMNNLVSTKAVSKTAKN